MSQGSDSSAGFKRDVAVKARIADILTSSYVQPGADAPNYLELYGQHVARVNVLGVVVSREEGDMNGLAIDDGTAMCRVTVFSDEMFARVAIGSVAVIIGRPREYSGERYISGEIVQVVPKEWLDVRRKELEGLAAPMPREEVQEEASPEQPQGQSSDEELIYGLIKSLDAGSGADMSEVIERSSVQRAESIIKGLLEAGDIFEAQPGKLKALE